MEEKGADLPIQRGACWPGQPEFLAHLSVMRLRHIDLQNIQRRAIAILERIEIVGPQRGDGGELQIIERIVDLRRCTIGRVSLVLAQHRWMRHSYLPSATS